MKDTIEITIKQKHFAKSLGYISNDACPLALAVNDYLIDNKIKTDVSVSTGSVSLGYDVRYDAKCGDGVWYGGSARTEAEPRLHVDDLIDRARSGIKVPKFKVILTLVKN